MLKRIIPTGKSFRSISNFRKLESNILIRNSIDHSLKVRKTSDLLVPQLLQRRLIHQSTFENVKKLTDVKEASNELTKNKLVTKESLLSQASSLPERLMIRLKWLLIKNNRPFNIDEISAFISWILLSHLLWIILGTTTFVSLLFLALNSIFAKELVCKTTGKIMNWYLKPFDFEIKFEDSISPDYSNGVLKCEKIKIYSEKNGVDLSIDSLKVSLSFKKWQSLKGLFDNVEITGMSGTLDYYKIKLLQLNENYELNNVKIMDSTVFLKTNSTKVKFSIYNCQLTTLRIKWLLLDFLNNGYVNGAINNSSLFTVHKRQHNLAYVGDIEDDLSPWKRITRLRLDRLDLETIGLINSDQNKQFNWIKDGKLDLIADIMPPANNDDMNNTSKYVVIDVRLQFNELQARLPVELPQNLAKEPIILMDELKPIITYVNNLRNNQKEVAPICFRIVKDLKSESSILDQLSMEIYIEFLKIVNDYQHQEKIKNLKQWSNTVAQQLLLVGLGAMA
ncbi:hypothetical protein WICMUC_000887 [Wickerhamomyces mucosus]|uniref:Mitochondrial distribution and morphology protein 32 n=1 Tax=Wickerhamomyces mucosus TaxID=1378264 RepID=A0A9P8PYD7_9ASCO|nr:hypothetical protein WICMUC_000887 [Wickerhamomyces mucosus]